MEKNTIQHFDAFNNICKNLISRAEDDILEWQDHFDKEQWEKTSFLANGHLKKGELAFRQNYSDLIIAIKESQINLKDIILVDRIFWVINYLKTELNNTSILIELFCRANNLENVKIAPKNRWFFEFRDIFFSFKEWIENLITKIDLENISRNKANQQSENKLSPNELHNLYNDVLIYGVDALENRNRLHLKQLYELANNRNLESISFSTKLFEANINYSFPKEVADDKKLDYFFNINSNYRNSKYVLELVSNKLNGNFEEFIVDKKEEPKQFFQFLKNCNQEEVAIRIKKEFENIKSLNLRILLEVLKFENLIHYGDREKEKICQAMRIFFEWEIGSKISIFYIKNFDIKHHQSTFNHYLEIIQKITTIKIEKQ